MSVNCYIMSAGEEPGSGFGSQGGEAIPEEGALRAEASGADTPEDLVSPLVMFTSTVSAELNGPLAAHKTTFDRVRPGDYTYDDAKNGQILAVMSNFGHKIHPAVPGARSYLTKKRRRKKARRRGEGNGSCFNSCLQLVCKIQSAIDGRPDKVYMAKVFPSKNNVQITGILHTDASDGREVLSLIVAFLNETVLPASAREAIARLCEGACGDRCDGTCASAGVNVCEFIDEILGGYVPKADVFYSVKSFKINMRNYKFGLGLAHNELITALLKHLFKALEGLEPNEIPTISLETDGNEISDTQDQNGQSQNMQNQDIDLPVPPFQVVDVEHTNRFIITLNASDWPGPLTVKVWARGKVNVLGTKSHEQALSIHGYFYDLFSRKNVRDFVIAKLPAT